MNPKQIITLVFCVFVILLIASTGAFFKIIKGFGSALGFYGLIIGVLVVLIIILGFLRVGSRRR